MGELESKNVFIIRNKQKIEKLYAEIYHLLQLDKCESKVW